MELPPDLVISTVGIVGGAANVLASASVVPAPGAGSRFRLWMAVAGTNDTSIAPGNWFWDATEWPLANDKGRIALPGFGSGALYWPGGVHLQANVGLGYQMQAATAGLVLVVTYGYTTESV